MRAIVAALALGAAPLIAPVGVAFAQAAEAPQAAIEAAMRDSAEGWNRGDLDRFLAVYSDDPATSFTSGVTVARGKQAVRERYRTGYREQFSAEGTPPLALSFSNQDFRMIGRDHALLIARWQLIRRGEEAAPKSGMTSLLFRRETSGWKIIADHSN